MIDMQLLGFHEMNFYKILYCAMQNQVPDWALRNNFDVTISALNILNFCFCIVESSTFT